MKLLTTANPKTVKSRDYGYYTVILHLAPASLSGRNVCPNSTPGCRASCLNTAGHGFFDSVAEARLNRTLFYFNAREEFHRQLEIELKAAQRTAEKAGLELAVRLNGTSDIPALPLYFAPKFKDVKFYDYTKLHSTLRRADLPENYHLTFSRSEKNEKECLEALSLGFNVSAVFAGTPPEEMWGVPVISGEDHDLRFLDPKPSVIALTAKGQAKKDETGFAMKNYV